MKNEHKVFELTEEDIKSGSEKGAYVNPFYQMFMRELKPDHIELSVDDVFVVFGEMKFTIRFSQKTSQIIRDFYFFNEIEPTTLYLRDSTLRVEEEIKDFE